MKKKTFFNLALLAFLTIFGILFLYPSTSVQAEPAIPEGWEIYTNEFCGYSIYLPAESIKDIKKEADGARYVQLPLLQEGTNLIEKYLNLECSTDSEDIKLKAAHILSRTEQIFNDVLFRVEKGAEGAAGSLYQETKYSSEKDGKYALISCILHSGNITNYDGSVTEFDYPLESAICEEVMQTFIWGIPLPPSPTPTLTETSSPTPTSTLTPEPTASPTPSPLPTIIISTVPGTGEDLSNAANDKGDKTAPSPLLIGGLSLLCLLGVGGIGFFALRYLRKQNAPSKKATKRVGAPSPNAQEIKKALLNAKEGKLQEAFDILREVIRRDPNDRNAWLYLGSVLAEMGKFEDAEQAYRRAKSLGHPNADGALAWLDKKRK